MRGRAVGGAIVVLCAVAIAAGSQEVGDDDRGAASIDDACSISEGRGARLGAGSATTPRGAETSQAADDRLPSASSVVEIVPAARSAGLPARTDGGVAVGSPSRASTEADGPSPRSAPRVPGPASRAFQVERPALRPSEPAAPGTREVAVEGGR